MNTLKIQKTEGRLTEVMSLSSRKGMCPGAQVKKLVSDMSQDCSVLITRRKAECMDTDEGRWVYFLVE